MFPYPGTGYRPAPFSPFPSTGGVVQPFYLHHAGSVPGRPWGAVSPIPVPPPLRLPVSSAILPPRSSPPPASSLTPPPPPVAPPIIIQAPPPPEKNWFSKHGLKFLTQTAAIFAGIALTGVVMIKVFPGILAGELVKKFGVQIKGKLLPEAETRALIERMKQHSEHQEFLTKKNLLNKKEYSPKEVEEILDYLSASDMMSAFLEHQLQSPGIRAGAQRFLSETFTPEFVQRLFQEGKVAERIAEAFQEAKPAELVEAVFKESASQAMADPKFQDSIAHGLKDIIWRSMPFSRLQRGKTTG